MYKLMPVGWISSPVSAYQAAGLVPFLVCYWICPGTGVRESTCVWFTLLDLFLQAVFPSSLDQKASSSPACVVAIFTTLHTCVADP